MPGQDQDTCINEIKEYYISLHLLGQTAYKAAHNCRHEHENGREHGHGGEAGEVVCSGKGNMSLPLNDEEEDWEMLMSGISDEMDRPGMSKDSGSGGTEKSGRP